MQPVLTRHNQYRHVAQQPLDPEEIRTFRAKFGGEILAENDPRYDDARRVFNAMIDRRPALVARPVGSEDIRRAVVFAREHAMPFSVKGGGHSVSGSAVCEGGLMLDLSSMKAVQVDARRRVAFAEPGLLLGELDRATQAAGLATPLGVISDTGIAGLTLGGGIGWLNGKYGLACDNLLAADMVTADGEVLRASHDEHPDLFWAIRGGSGNFGIAASFAYHLHPVGPVLAGSVVYPASATRAALRLYHEVASTAPDGLSTLPWLDRDTDGHTVLAVAVCWCGPIADGERALQRLRAFGPPLEDRIAVMDYCALQRAADDRYPPGRQHYWKAAWLGHLGDEAIEVMLNFAASKPTGPEGHVTIALQQMHGAAARVAPTATAFPHRRDLYDFLILSQWCDPADAERYIDWTRAFFSAMQPHAERAVYVNNLGTEGEDRVREAYGANYERLVKLKARYDPDNFFRANQNVRPRAASGL